MDEATGVGVPCAGKGACNTAARAEACVATHAEACANADLSDASAVTSQYKCMIAAPTHCTYTAGVTVRVAVAATLRAE